MAQTPTTDRVAWCAGVFTTSLASLRLGVPRPWGLQPGAPRAAGDRLGGRLTAAVLGLGLAVMSLSPMTAAAQEAEPGEGDSIAVPAAEVTPPRRPLLVGVRGVAEAWQDRFIVEHYRSSRLTGAAMVHVPVARFFGVEAEMGYSRTPSVSARSGVAAGMLEYVPMALTFVAVKQYPGGEVFGGVGYGMAVFTEQTSVGTVSGSKAGLDVRAGARIHTNLVKRKLTPQGYSGLSGLDVELLLGRRQHHAFGWGQGFDFSAWRLGAGMVVRL